MTKDEKKVKEAIKKLQKKGEKDKAKALIELKGLVESNNENL